MTWLYLAGTALRDPAALRADDGRDAALTARLLLVGAAGAAVFGAVAGSRWSVPLQAAIAAAKLPLVLLLPLVVTLPTLQRLLAWSGGELPWRRLTREAALAVARVGLVLLGAVPLVWLAWSTLPRHDVAARWLALVVAGAFGAGTSGLFLVADDGRRLARLAAIALLALTVGQSAWMLRPFVFTGPDASAPLADGKGLFVVGLVPRRTRVADLCTDWVVP